MRLVKFILILASLSLAACSGQNSPTYCTGDNAFILNSFCETVRWNSLPVTMTFDTTVPEDIRIIAMQAASEWEAAIGKPLFVFDSIETHASENQNIIKIVPEEAWVGDIDENAKTVYAYQNRSMIKADILIRARVLTTRHGNMNPHTVLLHELGHVLGLAHDDKNKFSIMYPQTTQYNSIISDLDKSRMLIIYP